MFAYVIAGLLPQQSALLRAIQQPAQHHDPLIRKRYRARANGIIHRQALKRAAGNQTQAAKLLRISRDQLRYRLEKFSIES